MQELWKEIPGYEGYYEISTLGRIRSIPRYVNTKGNATRLVQGNIKTIHINKYGYNIITLHKERKANTFTVHQLMAITFIPGFVKGTQINHIDGNKTNNTLINLEPSNSSHNQLHAVATGLKPLQSKSKYHYVCYIKNPRAIKRWAVNIKHNGKRIWKTFMTEIEAAKYADEYLDSIGDTIRQRNNV